MKLAFILLITIIALTVHGETVLNDNGTVTKNGISLNNASDALLNGQLTSAEFNTVLQAKLTAANAATAQARDDLAALQAQLTTTLNTTLSQLQTTLKDASGDEQRAVIAGQIALVETFRVTAGKSPAQLAVEAAQAAADKAATDLAAAKAKLEQN